MVMHSSRLSRGTAAPDAAEELRLSALREVLRRDALTLGLKELCVAPAEVRGGCCCCFCSENPASVGLKVREKTRTRGTATAPRSAC